MNEKDNTVKSMLEAGADFLQNLFEVEFAFRDKEEEIAHLLYTRVGSIEIPRLKNKTFTLKTANGSVTKIASKFTGGYETSIHLRPDQNCYILDAINNAAGTSEKVVKESDSSENFKFNPPKIFPASSIFTDDIIGLNKKHRLDIIVKNLGDFTFEKDPKKDGKYSVLSEWILEDVKIVGVSNLSFSVDQTSPQDITMDIIIKSVYLSYY